MQFHGRGFNGRLLINGNVASQAGESARFINCRPWLTPTLRDRKIGTFNANRSF